MHAAALLLAWFALSPWLVLAQAPLKVGTAIANQTKPEPVPAAAPPAVSTNEHAIPLPQVAERAETLDRLLDNISNQLTPAQDLNAALSEAKAQAAEIHDRAVQVENMLTGTPNTLELRDEAVYWRALGQRYTEQRKLLTARAANLEEQIRLLDEQQVAWQATWEQIHETTGIEAVVERVGQELENIKNTRAQARDQLNLVLTFQNQVSQQDKQISDLVTGLSGAEERLRGRVLERDSHPLWKAREARKLDQSLTTIMQRSAGREFVSASAFLGENKTVVLVVLALYVLGLLVGLKLKRYAGSGAQPELSLQASKIFERPFSIGLVSAMLGVVGHTALAPSGVFLFVYLLCLIMALRLLPLMIGPEMRPLLYTMVAFNLLDGICLLTPFTPVLKRELFALAILGTIVALAWFGWSVRTRQLRAPGRSLLRLEAGIWLAFVFLSASLAANIFGFVALSQVLAAAILLGSFTGAALYCVVHILNLILSVVLRSKRVASMPEAHRRIIEVWGKRLMAFSAFLLWMRSELYLLTIHDSFTKMVSSILQYPIGSGRVNFTLEGVLSVIVILLAGYALATGISFGLQKVLTSRLSLGRGLPFAASKVTYYALMLLVLFAALATAGIDLNKFTVITGALGVGVGFGLQNVVNNFASGLILLFERPIRVDDVVEVGGLVGTVKRIGARSSTVQTFQGAEVIVPNSNLLSNQVINWTLSSPWRRVDVTVGVAYGSDPERVLRLLVDVAESNSGVMRDPEPVAFFLGFGDNSLNFELRFWSARQETWLRLKSDVSVAIAKALHEAGIEIPFPQQDLHVRSIDTSVRDALLGAAEPEPSRERARHRI